MQYNAFMKVLTIRGVSRPLAAALEREKTRRGQSLNQTILDMLGERLGVGDAGPRRNGLARLAGSWSLAIQRWTVLVDVPRRRATSLGLNSSFIVSR